MEIAILRDCAPSVAILVKRSYFLHSSVQSRDGSHA